MLVISRPACHVCAYIRACVCHAVSSKTATVQTGYIRKRYIGTNIRKILDTVEYLERTNNSGILLILDFEKAFDTVEWSFLFKTLEEFNFGPQFINWIKLLYQDPVALIKNNGWFSNKVSIKWGIWQGCPVSALLFIMMVEILAIKLKKSTYKGIHVKTATVTYLFLGNY